MANIPLPAPDGKMPVIDTFKNLNGTISSGELSGLQPAPAKKPSPAKKPAPSGKKPKAEGNSAQLAQQAKDFADLHLVPMSEGSIKSITQGMDEAKLQAFQEYIKSTAQGLYPTFAKQIAAGIPTAHLVEPYRQVGKQMLGDQFEPDFVADPKSAMALTGGVDPATERPAPMSLQQWKQHIISHDNFGYAYTPAAHETANQIIEAINKGFSQPPSGGNR